jgi:hypothetical protein
MNEFRSTASRAGVYEASPSQSRLIMMRHAPGGVPSQIVAKHLLLRGRLDVDRLRDALVALVRRHPILRTNYAFLDTGEVLAIVHDTEGPGVFTASARSGLSGEDEIREHVVGVFEELSRRFLSPDRHSILQAVLVPHGEDLNSLVIVVDHVAIDERSRVVLQRELALIYAGRQDDLGEVHPYDAAAVRSTFPAIEDTPTLRDLLTPLPPRYLVSPDTEGDPDAFRPLTAVGTLDPATSDRLDDVARQLRCTRFTAHVAAVMWTLKQFSQSDDIGLVTPMDTRTRSQEFQAVGYFQNQVFLRSRSPRSDGFEATLRECRTMVREAFQRRDYPVASLTSYVAAKRKGKLYRNALYQVMLVYSTENADEGWTLDSLDVTPFELERAEAANELRIHLTEHAARTEMVLVGAAGSFEQPDLERLLSLWQHAEKMLITQT